MNILFIEPFYSGSHKYWLDDLKSLSTHNITLLTMEGKFWKWRMYGSGYTMAMAYLDLNQSFDLILTSDMLDLPTFLAKVSQGVRPLAPLFPPVGIYFHENQFAYPWQEGSEDVTKMRDVHYGMMNYASALVADFLIFNSEHNRRSFLQGARDVLNKMPDYPHLDTVDSLLTKSHILPIGIHPPCLINKNDKMPSHNKPPLILWNHRLEYDKNPEDFFDALDALKKDNLKFQVAFLCETRSKKESAYRQRLDSFKNETLVSGYQKRDDYTQILSQTTILPCTSIHDFFGISVMEAISYGAYPLLPNRLTYPDLYDATAHPELFYHTKDEFIDKLKAAVIHSQAAALKSYAHLTTPYLWETVIKDYDALFSSLL